MRLLEQHHLDIWARSVEAKGRFPELLKDLIWAVIPPQFIRFPSDSGVYRRGWDGEVVNDGMVNEFVPIGSSKWEITTQQDFLTKAEKDYANRSAIPPADSRNTTLVIATPYQWSGCTDWCTAKKTEGIWADVIVLDGTRLLDWLAKAPSQALRFAMEVVRSNLTGLRTAEAAWDDWVKLTSPELNEAIVTCGRENEKQELIAKITAGSQVITVMSPSAREAFGFVLATLRSAEPEERRANFLARTIVVDDEQVALEKLSSFRNMIVLLKRANDQVSGSLLGNEKLVIIPEGQNATSVNNRISLPRTVTYDFAKALETAELTPEQASRIARECGSNVTVLQRLQASSNFVRPPWSIDRIHARALLPAVLAGRWNDRSESDQATISKLAGRPYSEVCRDLQPLLHVDDPPIKRIENLWILTSHVDAFVLIAGHLTSDDMRQYREAFLEVFSRIDPGVDVPPDEWYRSDPHGIHSNSSWLRTGLAESMLLVSQRGATAAMNFGQEPQVFAEEVISSIPSLNNDWRVLASIRDQYYRMMEAAPRPLLDSLDRMIEAHSDDLAKLFVDRGIFGGGWHTELLWGLEALAWNPSLLSRVAVTLASLAAIDPGGRLLNRPLRSLREIFLYWHSSTSADNEQRLTALDSVLDTQPEIGWKLLINLLPRSWTDVADGTHRPELSSFEGPHSDTTSKPKIAEYLNSIFDRIMAHSHNDPTRLGQILEHLAQLSKPQRTRFMDHLEVAVAAIDGAEQEVLRDHLREWVYKHKKFADAEWAASTKDIARIERILESIPAHDLISKWKWLFDDHYPDIPNSPKDLELEKAELDRLRKEAIREILSAQGTAGILSFAAACKLPGFIAEAVIPVLDEFDDATALVEDAMAESPEPHTFASHLSFRAFKKWGDDWSKYVIDTNPSRAAEETGSLVLYWPQSKTLYALIEGLGVEVVRWYWKNVPVMYLDDEEINFQIEKLLQANRACRAFDTLHYEPRSASSRNLIAVFDAAFDEMDKADSIEAFRRLGIDSHDVLSFLENLRKRKDIDEVDVAKREYRALPLLTSLDARNLTLHEMMAKNADFFMDILCDVFLPSTRNKDDDIEPTPEVRARAKAGYTLLHSMTRIPGTDETGVDTKALIDWIGAVLDRAKREDREEITEVLIGELLAHAPNDKNDNAWPDKALRSAIEAFKDTKISQGIMTGRFNARGTYTKAVYEGGEQERDLASQYRKWAQICQTKWPHTGRLLEAIAIRWDKEARRADIEAEQDKHER